MGATWNKVKIPQTDSQTYYDVTSINFKADTIYLGMYKTIGLNFQTIDTIFVSRSTDRGKSWEILPCGVSMVNKRISYLCFLGDTVFAATPSGVYMSVDNCVNWDRVYVDQFGDGDYSLIDLRRTQSDSLIAVSSTRGVFISTDRGGTWSEFTKNLPDKYNLGGIVIRGNNAVVSIAYTGIYVTQDGGGSWKYVPTGSNANVSDIIKNGDKFYTSFYNPASQFSSGFGPLVSADNCESWNRIYNPDIPKHDPIWNLFQKDSLIICALYNPGSLISYDAGASWTKQTQDFNSVYFTDSSIIAGTESGTCISKDNGHSWKLLEDPVAKSLKIQTIFKNDNVLYGCSRGNVYISNDNGITWRFSDSCFVKDSVHIRYFGAVGHTVYALPYDSLRIYKSIDHGTHWEKMPINIVLPGGAEPSNLFCSGNNMIIGISGGGIYLSQNEGASWTCITRNAGKLNAASINAFKMIDNYLYACTNSGLFRIKQDDISSVKEETPGFRPYFYNYQPYPNPGQTEIQTKIYWESDTDIDESGFAVYDVSGKKVADSHHVRLDRLTEISGYVVWDCSGIEPGVYIIEVKQDNISHYVKVAVGK